MGDIAIHLERISKQYHVGRKREQYKTLRDTLTNALVSPFSGVRKLLRGQAVGTAKLNETIWALKDVSFEIKCGEVVGIIGRNGAGKSTLLKILSRITEPTTGFAKIYGRVGSLLEVGTGFHPELTGRENIYLNGAILGMKKAEIEQKFDEIVAFAEVEKFIDTPVKHYSSGMYLRLAFAVAAHLEPEILLVDEVLAVGDAAFQRKCLGKMGEVAKEGRTVLFVSHNMAAIENLCDTAIVLNNGRLVCKKEVKSAIRTYLEQIATNMTLGLGEAQLYRTGNRQIIFTHFHIEDTTGNKIGIVQSGQDIVLVFSFACLNSHEAKNVAVGFGIHSTLGDRLAVLYTFYSGQNFETVPSNGEFRCQIPRFPFAPGRYFVFPRIEVDGLEADFPRDGVGFIDVESGDFFGTGRMVGDRGPAPFLLSGHWSITAL